jgi:hypothetical protein
MTINHEIYFALALEEFKRRGDESIRKGEKFALSLEYDSQTITTSFKLVKDGPDKAKKIVPVAKAPRQKIRLEDKA